MAENSSPRQITVAEMAPHVHNFKIGENKVDKISGWMIDWIKESLKKGRIKPYDFLPTKGDLAFHICVSKGTMQNVFRCIEDTGLVESKQKIGTYIKSQDDFVTKKLTSKRDTACEAIKQYIIDNNYQVGKNLFSLRKLSTELNIATSTLRVAMNNLVYEGVLEKKNNQFFVHNTNFIVRAIEHETLVEKVSDSLKNFIETNYKKGEKIPSNSQLAKKFNVSIKTIYDSIKLLSKEGYLNTRRGYYGTIVSDVNTGKEAYCYEKAEYKIKQYIMDNCKIGEKIPSIREFSKQFEFSTKTIKKALDNLAYDGYVTFARGRNGGTFVTDIPQIINEKYTWIALNPDYINNNNDNN